MKLTINGNSMAKILGLTLGIMEKKSTIPVLSNLLIEPQTDNTIRVIGTDLDITSITVLEVADLELKGKKEAEGFCVQGRKLSEILKSFPNGTEFSLETQDNNWVSLQAGKYKSRLAGVASGNFPEIPTCNGGLEVQIPARVLSNLIELTSFAITMEQSRFSLSGAKLELKKDEVRMVATDGHRLSLAKAHLEKAADAELDTLIPKKALMELLKVCRENDGEDVRIRQDQHHLFFHIGGTQIIARKLSGSFPNYEMVIPQGNDKQFTIPVSQMREVLGRVRQMADERTSSVKFTVKSGELVLEAQSAEEGEATESVEIEYTGEEVFFGVNSNYGLDALAAIGNFLTLQENKNITVYFKDTNTQILIKLQDESRIEFCYVLMPLRI